MRIRVLEPCSCSLATARDLIMLAIFWWGHTAERFQGRRLVLPLMAAEAHALVAGGLQLAGYRHRRRHASQTPEHTTRPWRSCRGRGCGFPQFLFLFLGLVNHEEGLPPAKRTVFARDAGRYPAGPSDLVVDQPVPESLAQSFQVAYYRRPGTWAMPNRRSRTLPPERGPPG
jgi:hypothetical protein